MLAFILYVLLIAVTFYIWSVYDTAKMVKSIEPDAKLSTSSEFVYKVFKK